MSYIFVSFLRITFKIGNFTRDGFSVRVYYELKVENGNKSINLQLIVKLQNRELKFRTMSWLVYLKTA